jgi:ketosteroid isomerase-like protein
MSQENVERFRATIEAWNRRDIEAALQGVDPEIQFEHRLAALQGSFVGLDAVRRWFADLLEHFSAWRVYCDDIRDLGDRVLALGTNRATGKESGLETELPFTVLARFKDGLMIHFIDYGDRDQALKAAGLLEQDAHADS